MMVASYTLLMMLFDKPSNTNSVIISLSLANCSKRRSALIVDLT